MSEENTIEDISEVEGVIDDTPQEDKQESQPQDNTKELVNGLQDQIQKLSTQIEQGKDDKKNLIDQFGKAVGFIEGSGIGKYDPDTGAIIKQEAKQVQQNNNYEVDEIKEIERELKTTEKDLARLKRNGDISDDEYWQRYQEEIVTLRDELNQKKYDKKFNDFKNSFQKKEEPKEKTKVADPLKGNEVYNKYSQIAEAYPDVGDKQSNLYKKMNELFATGKYPNASFNEGKGNPYVYERLLNDSLKSLENEGIQTNSKKQKIRNTFNRPDNEGYSEPERKRNNVLTKNDVGMLVSQGFSNKSLINEINQGMQNWVSSNAIVMSE